MHHLAYVSSAKHEFSQQEIDELLEKARSKNARLSVTGLLVYRDGNFIQILEGDQKTIFDLFDTIKNDERHQDVTMIDEGFIDSRQFGEWSMNFRRSMNKKLFTAEELASDNSGYLHMIQRLVENNL